MISPQPPESGQTPPRRVISRERRRHVVKLVKRVGLHSAGLSDDALLTYVVGALIASDVGYVADRDLFDARKDPKLVALASNILAVTAIDSAGL